jgi:AraC family ethanolamine operon transcriptional activator
VTAENASLAGTVEAYSLEEHQEVFKSVFNLRFLPLQEGSMQSKTQFLSLPGLLVYREWWNLPVHLQGELLPGQIAFALPASEGVPFRLLGRPLDSNALPWVGATAELDMLTRKGFDNVVMIFEDTFLRRIAARVKHPLAERQIPGHPISTATEIGKAQSLRSSVESVLAGLEHRSAGRALREAKNSRLAEHLADALLDTLAAGDTFDLEESGDSLTATQKLRLVQRCVEYARTQSFEVTIPELCALTGKSRRTLEYAFLECAGTSPGNYLRLCRLRKVHLALANAEPGAASVTRVATQWGFFDLGAFAGSYRRAFGELPSQTLRRVPRRATRIPEIPSTSRTDI